MKKHTYIYKKAASIMLSFVMIVGLLGGMKLDARAEERTIDLASYIKDHLGKTIDLGTISGDSSIKAKVTYDMGLCYMSGVLVDERKDDYSNGAAGSSIDTALNGINHPGVMSLDLTKIEGIDPQLTYSLQIYGWQDDERYGKAYHIFLYLSIITIDTLNITVTQPEAGQPLPTVENGGVNVTEGAEVTEVKWDAHIDGSLTEVADGVKAEYNTQYVLNVRVKAKDGYKFGDRVVYDATINGERTEVSSGEEKGTLWFSKYFPKTELDPYEIRRVDITVPQPVAGERLPDVTQVTQSITGAKVESLEWHEGESLAGPDVTGGKAKGNTIYTVRIRYDAEEGYSFGAYPSATVNSQYANWEIWDKEHKIFCVIYRFQAKGSDQANTINSVNITIDLPVGGQPFPSEVPSLSNATGMIEWMKLGGVRVSGLAEYDTKYIAQIEYEATNGYVFADNVTASVNGEPASFTIIEGTNNKNCLITRTFQTAKEGQAQTVSNIEITVPKPVGGQALPTISDVKQTVTGAKATKILWCEGDNTEGKLYVTGNAKYNTVYTMVITYEAEDGFIFGNNTTATVNGNPIKFLISGFSKDKKGEVTYTFPATDLETTHTINSADITVDSPEAGKQLPTVKNGVKVSATGVKVAKVEWSADGKAVTGLAGYNTVYTVKVYLDTEDNYEFGTDMSATVNNTSATVSTDGSSKYVTYTFPKTETEPVQTISSIEITAPQPEAGQKLPYFPDVTYETTEAKGTGINWYEGMDTSGANVAGKEAEYNTVYTMRIRYEAKDGFMFGSNTTATVNGNMTGCEMSGTDVCYVTYTFPATDPKPSDEGVEITEGNDSTYKPGSNESLTFRGSGKHAYFDHVEVDGIIVDRTNYDVREGSTIITFTPEYLATLTNGSHTIEMFWNINGAEKSAAASFYIGEKSGEVVPGNTGTTQPANNTESKPRHVCSFEWVITLDPTTEADGLEEYKCMGCGVVKESHPIPASVAVIKDFYGKVKEAPEKGSITYDAGKLHTISDYILKKMAERNDVSVTVKFEYQNKKYQLIFPAGLDYSAVLNDEETMYGYFGAAAKLGLKVTGQ